MAVDTISIERVDALSDIWGSDLRVRLPSADGGAIDREIANAVQEFVQQSGVMILEVTQDIVGDQALYEFSTIPTEHIPTTTPFNGIRGLYCHAVRLENGDYLRINQHRPRGAFSTPAQTGKPTVAHVPSWPGTVELFPVPNESLDGQKLTVVTSAIFLRPVVSVPEIIHGWYYEAILDGATGRMMSHPKRPYSDPRLAQYYLRRFRNQMRVAADEAKRKWSNAESEFRFNPSWAHKVQLRHS